MVLIQEWIGKVGKVAIGVVESEHDGFTGKGLVLGEKGEELVGGDGVVAFLGQVFEMSGKRFRGDSETHLTVFGSLV